MMVNFFMDFGKFFTVIGIVVIACILFSAIWIQLLKKWTRAMIYISIFIPIIGFGILLATSVLFYFGGSRGWLGPMIFSAIMLIFSIIYYFFYRVRIPFAVEMIRCVIQFMQNYPATQTVAFFSMIIHFIFICFYSYTAFVTPRIPNGTFRFVCYFYIIFSFYWVSEVIKNVVHVTVSGVVATWYFLSGSPGGIPENPTLGALKRSVTTSFGSICLGSLLVAIIKTIKAFIRSLRSERDSFVTCFLDCIISCIENLVRYFNQYAFCQVAIYGKTYFEAATATWNLISSSGVEAILNDNIVSGVLTMSCLIVSLAGCILSGFLGFAFFSSDPNFIFYITIFATFGFIIGFFLMNIFTTVMDSGVICTFICFAEDREVLRTHNPELYNKLIETYNLWG